MHHNKYWYSFMQSMPVIRINSLYVLFVCFVGFYGPATESFLVYYLCLLLSTDGAVYSFQMEDCVFCSKPLSDLPTVKLRDKGSETINRASDERQANIHVVPGQEVHVNCRRDFIHKRNNTNTNTDNDNHNSATKCSTRSSGVFDFKHKCIFCSQDAKINHRKRGYDVLPVRILPFQKSIERVCSERNDQWAHDVTGRIASIIDLPATEALYHQTCSVNFRTKRQLPKEFVTDSSPCKMPAKSPGRPEATDTTESFKIDLNCIGEN